MYRNPEEVVEGLRSVVEELGMVDGRGGSGEGYSP